MRGKGVRERKRERERAGVFLKDSISTFGRNRGIDTTIYFKSRRTFLSLSGIDIFINNVGNSEFKKKYIQLGRLKPFHLKKKESTSSFYGYAVFFKKNGDVELLVFFFLKNVYTGYTVF